MANLNKMQISALSGLALLRHVFGMHQGQTLTEFVAECKTVKEDAKFIEEVRAYALANAFEA